MNKKSNTRKDEPIIKVKQEENKVEIAIRDYYSNGAVSNFLFSPEQDPSAFLYALTKMPPFSLALTQNEMKERCKLIRYNVARGFSDNIEIQFNNGRQLSNKIAYPLGDVLTKITPIGADGPKYFFIEAGNTLDVAVFLGGGIGGFMLIKDECGADYFIQLYEFYLLSLRTAPNSIKEIGLMTSFASLFTLVHTSPIFATNLGPVKTLLLSDLLRTEWQRAEDTASESSVKEIGGDDQ